jgi:hypothetical protein
MAIAHVAINTQENRKVEVTNKLIGAVLSYSQEYLKTFKRLHLAIVINRSSDTRLPAIERSLDT